MKIRVTLVSVLLAAASLACAVSSGTDGAGAPPGTGGKTATAGCTTQPDCKACGTCFDRCTCETGQLDLCVTACVDAPAPAGGSGGSSAGGSGSSGAGGSASAGAGGSSTGGGGAGAGAGAGAGGSSAGGGGSAGSGGSSSAGTCCSAQTSAGCSNAQIEGCVCAQDDYCCKTAWDSLCVGEVESFGCGSCAGGSGGASGGSGGSGGASGGSGGSGGTSGSGGTGGSAGAAGTVEWLSYPEQHTQSNAGWSSYMTDVIRHLPLSYGNTYYDSDKVTYVHETTHGINSHLRNYFNKTGKKANGFYVGGNKGVIVVEPKIWKSDANPYVPQSLRDSRYNLYLVGSSDWNDTPLYLFDEWIAYTNGTDAAVNLVKEGKWNAGWRDTFGSLEFTVYAYALAMAVEAKDPTYFQGYAQFRALLQWNAERAMALYKQASVMPEFKWDKMDAYYGKLKQSSDAASLRAFIKKTHGEAWAQQVMGF